MDVCVQMTGERGWPQVSSICDADKSLPVLDPDIQLLVPGRSLHGPARTVRAVGDHLPVLTALQLAQPGDVLVVSTERSPRAVLGELFATEAERRGLAGIVVDGFCRDLAGLRGLAIAVFARGTTPASGSTVMLPATPGTVSCGGVTISDGDIVVGDDDGVIAAAAARIEAALPAAYEIEQAEQRVLDGLRAGHGLDTLTNYPEHVRRLEQGEPTQLTFLA
jgi:4-hydroxy-4-methyl-2-oxoglutarate aldolase